MSIIRDILLMEAVERLSATKVIRALLLYLGGLLAGVLTSVLCGYVIVAWIYGMRGVGRDGVAALLITGGPLALIVFSLFVLKKDGVKKGVRKFLFVLAVLIFVGAGAYSAIAIPENEYLAAVEQLEISIELENDDNEYAQELVGFAEHGFEKLGAYKDSASHLETVRQQKVYLRALEREKNGDDYFAAKEYDSLGDYRDSAQRAAACWESYNTASYRSAVSFLDKGKYFEGYRQMRKLRGYAPADEMLATDPRLREGYEMTLQPFRLLEFGRYTYGDDAAEKVDVDWIILAREGDRALLLSERALERHTWGEGATWAESELRTWMNSEFLRGLFTEEELMLIVPVENEGSTDFLFLLSADEWNTFRYKPDMNEECRATSHARGAESGYEVIDWILRDPAMAERYNVEKNVDLTQEFYVRPAVWVTLDPAYFY